MIFKFKESRVRRRNDREVARVLRTADPRVRHELRAIMRQQAA